jgi:DNA polymerase elongation subunit (family B)
MCCLQDEVQLLCGFVGAIMHLDPDIIVGWDLQRSSLGYLVERWAVLAIAFRPTRPESIDYHLLGSHWTCPKASQGNTCDAIPVRLHVLVHSHSICSPYISCICHPYI